MESPAYLAMHVLLSISAAIIFGLMIWLAYQIITSDESPHLDTDE